MFAPTILLIPFFHLFQSSKPFHSILFFSTIFFNFPNPYTISLNLNHLYHLEICKVKLFSKPFFKLFFNLPFAPTILPILFHSIFSLFSILQTVPFHFNFFNHFFQLSKSLCNIFKSQSFIVLYHLEISQVKPF